jgi:hypothetical protein
MDIAGRTFISIANTKSKTVNIENLSNGIYVIRITVDGVASEQKFTIAH